ncbi:cyclin-like protein [Choanephora cucurbitarum]|nr:cyclin-like protein [Choanephora cucurbitarum]
MTEQQKKPSVFEESTQYQHWRFSPEKIWDIRNKSTEAAISRVRRNLQEEINEHTNTTEHIERDYLSAKEEHALCSFYEIQLQAMSKHCHFSNLVMATAVIYMKRFYLHNTVMDYHPKDVFLTCLFLATKSESERISIDDFGKTLRLPNTANVLKLEFTLSQGLKFQYYVHHPYRPAYGFFLDMQTAPAMDMKALKETYKRVDKTIADILLTDLPLIYQPSQLALAAFMIAGKDNQFDQQIKQYIQHRFSEQEATTLLDVLEGILAYYRAVPAKVTQEEARKIDYKLKLCMNPAMNPDSAM